MDLGAEFGGKSNNPEWMEYDDAKLLVARLRQPEYRKKLRKLQAPFLPQIQRNKLGQEKSNELVCKAMVGTILQGWENIKEDGVDIEYSEDSAFSLLFKYEQFREDVIEFALSIDNRVSTASPVDEEAEEDLKK